MNVEEYRRFEEPFKNFVNDGIIPAHHFPVRCVSVHIDTVTPSTMQGYVCDMSVTYKFEGVGTSMYAFMNSPEYSSFRIALNAMMKNYIGRDLKFNFVYNKITI